jgi:hypothetical protein
LEVKETEISGINFKEIKTGCIISLLKRKEEGSWGVIKSELLINDTI